VNSLAGATLLQYLLPARDRGAGTLVVGACGDAALLEWAPWPDAAPGDGKPQARRDPKPSPPRRTLHITLAIFVLCSLFSLHSPKQQSRAEAVGGRVRPPSGSAPHAGRPGSSGCGARRERC